jgi:hypothetical protein
MEFARNNNQTDPKVLFNKIDKTTLSRNVKKSGKNRMSKILDFLKGKHVGVALDAGFKGKRNFVVALLLLPYYGIKSIFYSLYVCSVIREGYARLGADIIQSLAEKGMRVLSFCTDGLQHQVLALSMNSTVCFTKYLTQTFAMFFSPCLCHRIHLAYSDVFKYCPFLSLQLFRVNELVTFLRKKTIRATVHLMCPQSVKTRWILIMFFLLFLPYFILICFFERDRSSVEMVYPLIVSAVSFYLQLENLSSIQENQDLLLSVRFLSFFLLRRTLDSVNKSKFVTAFIISPLGRSCRRFYLYHPVHLFFFFSFFFLFF